MVLIKSQKSKAKSLHKGKPLGFKYDSGLTLIEMLVAMTIFSVVISVAVGIFTTSLKSQRKILAQQQLFDQTSYLMEYMSRSIRMAKKDDIAIGGASVNCLSGDKSNFEITATEQGGIKFRTYHSQCWEFYLANNGQLMQRVTDAPEPYTLPLTAQNFTVNSFKIKNSGWDQADNLQPAVTVFLEIEDKDGVGMQIQTTISQRNLDIQY